jgi:hypothetical protein
VTFSPVLLTQPLAVEDNAPHKNFLGHISIPHGKGLVYIRTIPKGVTIMIDGVIAPKKTDVYWYTVPGVYELQLELDGYKPVHRTFRVEEGKVRNIDEVLEKL